MVNTDVSRQPCIMKNCQKLTKFTEINKNSQKLTKIHKNRQKLTKIDKNQILLIFVNFIEISTTNIDNS